MLLAAPGNSFARRLPNHESATFDAALNGRHYLAPVDWPRWNRDARGSRRAALLDPGLPNSLELVEEGLDVGSRKRHSKE